MVDNVLETDIRAFQSTAINNDVPSHALVTKLKGQLLKCGWRLTQTRNYILSEDEVPVRLTKTTTAVVKHEWPWWYSSTVISVPRVRCPGISLPRADSPRDVGWTFIIRAPRFVVIATYPTADRTVQIAKWLTEMRVKVGLGFSNSLSVVIEVAHPLLQNRIGSAVIEGALWNPMAWLVLALCGIFGEQIRKGMLVPLVRHMFGLVGLKYFDESKVENQEVPRTRRWRKR
jgi:hypothetical protein